MSASDGKPSPIPSSEDVSRALRRCWQPVARVEDLQRGPQRAVVLGETLAVFLTESGKPAVVADRCGHRGASLSMGKVKGETIQCPYHGWQWTDGGGCARIPSLEDQKRIPSRARIPAYPARKYWGLVWTALEEPIVDLPALPWFDPDTWTWGHGTPFEVPVSLGVTIENFRDVAHFAFVHPTTFGKVPEVIEPLYPKRDGLEVTLERKMLVGEDAEEIWGSLREVRYHVIAPNFTSVQMFPHKGERCLLHAARAVSATESVNYWIEGFNSDFDEYTLEEAIAFEERVYAEDRPIVSAIQPPELPLDPKDQASTMSDRFTLAYRQAFIEFVRRALAEREGDSAQLSSTAS